MITFYCFMCIREIKTQVNCGVVKVEHTVYWDLQDTVGLAFTCTQHFAVHQIKKKNSPVDSLLQPSFTPPFQLCECVFLSLIKQTEEDSRGQSADVFVGIVWEIMLSRRHFSLLQIFFIKYAERKETGLSLVRAIKITAWSSFHYFQ